jgi:hypothetical protein
LCFDLFVYQEVLKMLLQMVLVLQWRYVCLASDSVA